MVMNRAPFVKIMTLKRILATSISDVGLAISPGLSIFVSAYCEYCSFFSFFFGRTLNTNCPYITSFLRLCGILFLVMNAIVLVGFFMSSPNSFSSGPNLFAEDVLQFLKFWVSCKFSVTEKLAIVCFHDLQSLVDIVFQLHHGYI